MGKEIRFGDYRIVRKLGAGSFSIVWRAEEQSTGRTVALKILQAKHGKDKTMSERFARAGQALLVLDHPNIVTGYDAAVEEGLQYIAMEYMPGGSLHKSLVPPDGTPGRPISEEQALRIALECLHALEYLHGRDMVHRDVKPSNILFGENGAAKLGDFVLLRQEIGTDLTAAGAAVGSPHYMSPEQAMGKKAEPRSDLYGLGCVMYHMLTTQLPFEGGHALELMLKRITTDVPAVERIRRDLHEPTAEVVFRLTRREPEERYGTAKEAREAVEAALKEVE